MCLQAPRDLWTVNGKVLGSIKHHANLTQIVIRNTGRFCGMIRTMVGSTDRDQEHW